MATRKKRVYISATRQAQAQQTKDRILSSAKELFAVEGFDQVTIEQIAERASVSTPTVYSLFKSKRGVLRDLMDVALPPEQHGRLVQEGKRESSPAKRLAFAARIARQLYDAEKAQMDLLRGASVLHPEFKKLEMEREKRRYLRLEESIRELSDDKALLADLTAAKARDILWAFTGRDLYRMLVLERGWTSDAYEKWLAQALAEMLVKRQT